MIGKEEELLDGNAEKEESDEQPATRGQSLFPEQRQTIRGEPKFIAGTTPAPAKNRGPDLLVSRTRGLTSLPAAYFRSMR